MVSDCMTFGLLSANTNKFLERFPEFDIKRRNVMVNGTRMDIIERGGIRKGERCPICQERLEYISKDFVSTPCHHSFHFTCLLTLMIRSHVRPICRTELGFERNSNSRRG